MSYLRTIFMKSNNKSYRKILIIVLEKLCTLFTHMRSAPSILHLLPLEWSHTKTFIQYSITVSFLNNFNAIYYIITILRNRFNPSLMSLFVINVILVIVISVLTILLSFVLSRYALARSSILPPHQKCISKFFVRVL